MLASLLQSSMSSSVRAPSMPSFLSSNNSKILALLKGRTNFLKDLLPSISVFVSVALIAAAIVPLTWVYGLITGQTYDRVCDNSQILYRLNQIGKWTIVIGTALLILKYLLF